MFDVNFSCYVMDKLDFSGMTVNERLFLSGLMNKFDLAIKLKDCKQVEEILRLVDLDTKSIEGILEKYKMNNKKMG